MVGRAVLVCSAPALLDVLCWWVSSLVRRAVLVRGLPPWSGVLCCLVVRLLGRARCAGAGPSAVVVRGVQVLGLGCRHFGCLLVGVFGLCFVVF